MTPRYRLSREPRAVLWRTVRGDAWRRMQGRWARRFYFGAVCARRDEAPPWCGPVPRLACVSRDGRCSVWVGYAAWLAWVVCARGARRCGE